MHIPHPFIPLRAESEGLSHTVHVSLRDYTIGPDGMITSIKSEGQELLYAPMRIVSVEDGEAPNWDENYPDNESESFVQSRSDEEIVIVGTKQSDRFIINTVYTIGFDGNVAIDMHLLTRGKTVAQVFGIAEEKPTRFILNKLWVEIPLKADLFPLFHMHPNSSMTLSDGTVIPRGQMTSSGRLPSQSAALPFKPLLWLGNEERGLGYFSETNESWQPNDPEKSIELVREGDALILRLRLLDSHPRTWSANPEQGMNFFSPISFSLGLQATPVKPFPRQPYIHNAFHLDCGIKIKGNYLDYLFTDGRFDRLQEAGVTTLILHEKWNKVQNFPELSEYTKHQVCTIADECHKRGMKLLTYFGYELSTLAPDWKKLSDTVTLKSPKGEIGGCVGGGWWRVPYQRDYTVCYQSDYEDFLVNGILKIMDECHTDGVYLDGTAEPRPCCNRAHGCGWQDEEGNLHGTYPVRAIRRLFRHLYREVEARGGMINLHASGFLNFTVVPFVHQNWYGENLQFFLMKGTEADVNLDYFRAEYLGRNIGAPVELIAYANPPHWCFEQALATALLHGILPRPNDIGHPLDLMEKVWRIFDAYPIDKAEWMPYWKNRTAVSHEKVKISYYRYKTLGGEDQLLAFAVNISAKPIESVTLKFEEKVSEITDLEKKERIDFTFALPSYGYKILFIK